MGDKTKPSSEQIPQRAQRASRQVEMCNNYLRVRAVFPESLQGTWVAISTAILKEVMGGL
jgi:hypothetical protein